MLNYIGQLVEHQNGNLEFPGSNPTLTFLCVTSGGQRGKSRPRCPAVAQAAPGLAAAVTVAGQPGSAAS